MPIYEFYCPSNNRIYSFYARTMALAGKVPRCPDNARYRMERLVSGFSVTGRATERAAGGGGESDVNDGQMEAALAGMEREMGGMDLDNPDPRALAKMMRKMSSLTGERLPGQMDEMIRRMEAGEDPEKLEAEYGDAMEDLESAAGVEEDTPGKGAKPGGRAGRRKPTRDPVMYEMRDFL